MNKNTNILLTGFEYYTKGMIASSLVPFLESKNLKVTIFTGDIREQNNWDKYTGITHVIHLAALAGVRESLDKPELFSSINIDGTKRVMEFCAKTQAKLLFASTSNVYEWWVNPYAYTKQTCEHLAEVYPIEAIGMRFHTVWPGRDDMLFRMIENGEIKYINSDHTRDFIHVDDLCSAIYTILVNFDIVEPLKNVDIGSGVTVKVLDVFNKYWDTITYPHDVNLVRNASSGERYHTESNIQYLLDLGWKPEKFII
jgi:UDP-glucuronate 4-epimerase